MPIVKKEAVLSLIKNFAKKEIHCTLISTNTKQKESKSQHITK